MADDWQIGDLAVCLKKGAWFNVTLGTPSLDRDPAYGEICRVEHVCRDPHERLMLSGFYGRYLSSRFRKIRPDAHEDCEPEFVTLLKRIRVGEPA